MGNTSTNEDEDSIGSVLFPTFGRLVVFFLSYLRIQGKEGPRAVVVLGSLPPLWFQQQQLRCLGARIYHMFTEL